MNTKEIRQKLDDAQKNGIVCINGVKIIFDKYDILYTDIGQKSIDFSCRYIENVSIDINKIISIE